MSDLELYLSAGFALLILGGLIFLFYRRTPVFRRRERYTFGNDYEKLHRAEQDLAETSTKDWVIVKRCHGPGYNLTVMAEIVATLQSNGVQATFETFSSSSAEMGITNFVIKVPHQDEEEALKVLATM